MWPFVYRLPIVITSLLPLITARRARKSGLKRVAQWNTITSVLSAAYWLMPTRRMQRLDRVNAASIIFSHYLFVFWARNKRDYVTYLYLVLTGTGLFFYGESRKPNQHASRRCLYHVGFHLLGNLGNWFLYRAG